MEGGSTIFKHDETLYDHLLYVTLDRGAKKVILAKCSLNCHTLYGNHSTKFTPQTPQKGKHNLWRGAQPFSNMMKPCMETLYILPYPGKHINGCHTSFHHV